MVDRQKYLLSQLRYNEKHRLERRELARIWRINNREKKKNYDKIYQREYFKREEVKFKNKARNKLKLAIKLGKISRKVCEIKKCNLIGQGHHEDYAKPLEVRWLCRIHHEELHHPLKK